MPEAVLPRLSTDNTTAQLPSDPNHLLSPRGATGVDGGPCQACRVATRGAETASASLRLA